jgi:hypothetical protein
MEEYNIITNFVHHKNSVGYYDFLQKEELKELINDEIFEKYRFNFLGFWNELTEKQKNEYHILFKTYECEELLNSNYVEITEFEKNTINKMIYYLSNEKLINIIKTCYGNTHIEQYYDEKLNKLNTYPIEFFNGLDCTNKMKFIDAMMKFE